MQRGDKANPNRGVVFSHVEAAMHCRIYCPDCEQSRNTLWDLLLLQDLNILKCTRCNAEFLPPRVTLERVPPDDYTAA